MGQISRKLAALIESNRKYPRFATQLRKQAKQIQDSFVLPKDVKDIRQLIEEGCDPAHAAYVSAQHFTSFFAECISQFDELAPYSQLAGAAEDDYMPDGPPWSPLTRSYFTAWSFFDLRFGKDLETIGTCLLDVSEQLGLDAGMVHIIGLFQQSRMGIYEHVGIRESRVQLRELVTGDEFSCYVPSGYQGEKGELWYVRICPPPITHDRANYHVAFTTPYVLGECTKADWIAYLKKSVLGMGCPDLRDGLYALMKYGWELNFWNEYIFLSYHHYQSDVVFLAGLPDVKGSLPHANLE